MAYTVASDIAGLMETEQAGATAQFVAGSRLWNIIYPVATNDANTVQVPKATVPVAVASTAETASLTPNAITIAAVTVSPAQFGAASIVSTKALLGGSSTRQWILDSLVGKVVASFDTDIGTEFTDFTDAVTTIGGVASLSLFGTHCAQLRNQGFSGTMVAAQSVLQVEMILSGVTFAIPQTEEYIRTGYVGQIKGAELVALPEALMTAQTTPTPDTYGGGIWFKEYGIVVGYHAGDSISGIMSGAGAPAPLIHIKEVPIDVISTNFSAAVFSFSSEIAALGGVYTEYALA